MLYNLSDIPPVLEMTPKEAFFQQYRERFPELFGNIDLIAIERHGLGALYGLVALILSPHQVNLLSIDPHSDFAVRGNPNLNGYWVVCDDTFQTGKTARGSIAKLIQLGYKLGQGYLYIAQDTSVIRASELFSVS